MRYKPEDIYGLLGSINGIVWEADIDMSEVKFMNDQVLPMLGFVTRQWEAKPGFWESRIHIDDKHVMSNYRELARTAQQKATFEYRVIKADGNIAWLKDNVSVVGIEGQEPFLRGIMQDVTVTRRLREMERLEFDILRLNSDLNTPLDTVLNNYLEGLELFFPKMHACVHTIKNDRLSGGVSPSLPPAYLEAIDGMPIGVNEGSCGMAAAVKQQVIVSDIATDEKWAKHRATALAYELRACWSNPVINADGQVIATVSMYYKEPRYPSTEELQVMDKATALLRIIIENRQKTDIINDAHLMMLQSQELANFGNWRWDIQHDVVTWSPALYLIYGLNPAEFKATFAGYQERLHPDDRARTYQIIENVLLTKQDAGFEERIIRPDGVVRHLRSWARLKTDANGTPMEMIGACLDVTEEVQREEAINDRNRQLAEIAWIQSHVVRSPLTKVMALVDLIKNASTPEDEKDKLLEHLSASAQELDEQIQSICREINIKDND